MAHPKLQAVRERYSYRCGYCGVTEEDVGDELTVDHFHPITAGGDESDENLVYACVRCNQYKGALLPEATAGEQDQRLLHSQRHHLTLHLREIEITGQLEGLTKAGCFHIAALRLNRPALRANRQRRQLLELFEARLEQALLENSALRERITRLNFYVSYLEERLERSPGPTTEE